MIVNKNKSKVKILAYIVIFINIIYLAFGENQVIQNIDRVKIALGIIIALPIVMLYDYWKGNVSKYIVCEKIILLISILSTMIIIANYINNF